MPFRHLLWAKNSARSRQDPRADLQDVNQWFSLPPEQPEFPMSDELYKQPEHHQQPQWPENYFAPDHQFPQDPSYHHQYAMHVPYQQMPYTFDSSSLGSFSESDLTDSCEASSLHSFSQGSLHSSVSSGMYDSDTHSVQSLSRKGSTISSHAIETGTTQLCPALLQGGQCNPESCGPNAPCLQFVNDAIAPIEACVPDQNRRDIVMNESENQATDFTIPSSTSQGSRQTFQDLSIDASVNPQTADTAIGGGRNVKEVVSNAKSSANTNAESAAAKPVKRSRQRVAHSLVEKKYRENLNSKIMELYQTLKRAQLNPTGSQTHLPQDGDLDADDMDDEQAAAKVKKSDVLVAAMSYVQNTQAELRRKDEEIERLNERIQLMENWIRSSQSGHQHMMQM